MEKPRCVGVAGLKDSVDLAKVARVAALPDADPRTREVCAKLASTHTFLSSQECAEYSKVLELDARRLCAAHNLAVASSHADAVRISTLCALTSGLLDSRDEVEDLLVEMIGAPSQGALSGAVIDEVAGIVRLRRHDPRNREWAESVYHSL